MVANGKIPTRSLAKLPNSWSNRGRDEYLTREAYASFSRMIARAVAETGTNFQVYDAYRSFEEQVKWLKEYYEPVRAGRSYNTIRRYAGQRWGQKKGKPRAAQPGTSNHGLGISVDLHPGPIQAWMRKNAGRFGWVNDVPSEAWHWSYKHPQRDRYRKEGVLDHAAVQKAVGAEVDGKIGTGTVKLIKEFQKKHGLDVDGKVGPATKKKMGLSGKGEAAPAPSVPSGGASAPAPSPGPAKEPDAVLTPGKAGGFTYTYLREDWDTQGRAEDLHPYDAPVKGIYLHWPGSSDTFKGKSPEQIATVLRGYRRDHIVGKGWRDIAYGAAVDWAGRTYQLRGLDMEVGSNGGDASNSEAGSILFLLGTRETPTAEMIAGALGLLAQYAAKYGAGYLRGHRQSPDASTSCPGARIMGLIEDGSLNWSGKPGHVVAPDEPIVDGGAGHVVEDGRAGTDTIGELQSRLGVEADGRAAEDTWKALQEELDAPYEDGQISRQSHKAESLGNGIVPRESAWEYTGPNSEGSQTVELLQKAVGVKPDGVWFEKTTLALQKAMNRDPGFLRR